MKRLLKALVAVCGMSMASGVSAGVIALFTNFSENDPAITSFNLETQQSSLFGSIPLSDGNYPTGLTLGLDGNIYTNIRGHLGLVSFDINGNYLGKFSPPESSFTMRWCAESIDCYRKCLINVREP